MKNFLPRGGAAFRLIKAFALALLLNSTIGGIASADTVFFGPGAIWKYLDNGSNQGTAWRAPSFSDSAWASGPSELGYGDGDEATVVGFGSNASAKYITTYFRLSFTVADPAAFATLKLRVLRDDGAVIYLNGVEVRRDNMPAGTVTSTTVATTALGVPDEATFYESNIATTNLVAGNNVLAVELHQANGTSSDLSFDLELIGLTTAPGATVTRGPYLQKATPSSLIIRWRTNPATDSTVRYGTNAADLNFIANDATVTTEHEIALAGLTPNTQYYYSVGTSAATIASGSEYTFYTAPPVGTSQPTRVWVIGDSGTGDANAAAVRNAYTTFAGSAYTDLWLMLGDNAYNNGTDAEYQTGVFNMYPGMLRQTVLWPTIGNHDTASSPTPPPTLPYFSIFTLPMTGEVGGEASGTEKYYSFDYGNVHFICLDSISSNRSSTGPMAVWLRADLESTTQTWIVAFWHHPPYTKGSHNSDTEVELIEMRQNFLPLLEAGGVDLVLGGHSHSYERSFFIDGHYGSSNTFSESMRIDGGDGRENGTGIYAKPGALAANQGAVYAVAGSSGKLSNWTGGSTADTNPTPHPVMFASLRRLGSLVLDVNAGRMDVKFVRENGAIDDSFTISKSVENQAPTVSVSSPVEGAIFTAPATNEISAAASDNDGTVSQVDFYAGASLIASDTTAPFAATWRDVVAGTYALTATATDDLGATATSAAVNVTVTQPPTNPPAPPAALNATPGDARITLSWSASAGASSYSVKRATASGGPYTTVATGLTAQNYSDAPLSNGAIYFYVVSASNAAGESANSNEASATPIAPPATPGSLSATAGDASVALTWSASADATSYNLKRATLSEGPYTTIATGLEETGSIDTAVTNGTTYFYVVSAVNAGGESANSAQVTATPMAPPATPTALAATAGDARVTLTWGASATATSYNVKRSLASGGPFSILASGVTGTAYTDSAVTNGTTYYYVVSALNGSGESADSNQASAVPTTAVLAPPWVTQDIGAVGAPGSASSSNGTFTISGSGADIWGTTDEFRYVYQPATGDCEIRARVMSVQNTDPWAKAGVMIRSTLNANSPYAMVAVTPGNGVSFQRRTSTGGNSSQTTSSGLAAPYWVRIVRTGKSFRSYRSANGTTWTQIGSANITMPGSIYIGLPVTSHKDGTLCTATFSNVTATP